MGTFISTAPTESNFVLAGSTTLTATNQNIAVTGLSNTNYLIVARLTNAIAANKTLSIYLNADTTATNYYTQSQVTDGAGLSASRTNTARAGFILASDDIVIVGKITKPLDNKSLIYLQTNQNIGAAIAQENNLIENQTAIAGNITTITLNHPDANGFAIGSVVEVWELTT